MNLFEDIPAEKDSSEVLGVDQQVCTQFFYFTIESREKFKKQMKKAIPDLLEGQEPDKWNLSEGILALLDKYYPLDEE